MPKDSPSRLLGGYYPFERPQYAPLTPQPKISTKPKISLLRPAPAADQSFSFDSAPGVEQRSERDHEETPYKNLRDYTLRELTDERDQAHWMVRNLPVLFGKSENAESGDSGITPKAILHHLLMSEFPEFGLATGLIQLTAQWRVADIDNELASRGIESVLQTSESSGNYQNLHWEFGADHIPQGDPEFSTTPPNGVGARFEPFYPEPSRIERNGW